MEADDPNPFLLLSAESARNERIITIYAWMKHQTPRVQNWANRSTFLHLQWSVP